MTNFRIILEKDVPCTLRDGTILYADIYRPDQKGSFPVLLTRLPYNKNYPFYSHRYLDTNRLVQNGYVVIIQDVRGRYASEGDFSPFENEAEDGYDTVEWAASLPYSSGKVGMFGLSYYGFTQLLAAVEKPPHLYTIFPAMTLNDLQHNMIQQQGAKKVASLKTWTLESMVPNLIKRKYKEQATYEEKLRKWAHALNHLELSYHEKTDSIWSILNELGVAHFYSELLTRQPTDKKWDKVKITNCYDEINIPAFHLGGWYDNFLQATIENFLQMKERVNFPQKLIIGPWTHGDFSSMAGELNFGVAASENFLNAKEDLTNLHLRWFDYWLKGKETGIQDEPPISIFVMGINEWRDEYEWPLNRTHYTPYYFHSNGQANSRFGDGVLNQEKPKKEPQDTYLHNPNNPVPTHGGQTLFYGIQTSGPKNQSLIEERDDIIIYTSDPLEKAVEVTGPVKVILWAKTDAKDTDFTAKLVDVHPDGRAYNLTDGIVRASYQNGSTIKEDLNGKIIRYEIDLWATSNVFLPEHRIRVEIASSNHPRFDVNHHTGSSSLQDKKEFRFARQTIYHDESYPSHIILPIIEGSTSDEKD